MVQLAYNTWVRAFHGVWRFPHGFFLRRDLTAIEIAAVHTFFSMWNPLNDIFSGFLADEWVARGFGTRLSLVVWAHIGYAASTLFAFQDTIPLPMWMQYSLAIFASDGFA